MADENTIMVYPFPDPDNKGWWEQTLRDAQANDLLPEAELTICIEQGCISIATLRSIRNKILSTFLGSTIFTMAWLLKIKKHLNISEEDWNSYFKIE
jgi:hypothetical protein